MTNDCIAQSWFRFLRMVGSPTSLCCPQVISHTPQVWEFRIFVGWNLSWQMQLISCFHNQSHLNMTQFQFMQYILLRDDSIEPHQHPCLLMLPQIFLKAMKGIASQVDAFLGKSSRVIRWSFTHLFFIGIFQPVVWSEGIIHDNTLSTNNQSNTSSAQQRQSGGSGLSRSSGAEQNSALGTSSNSNSVGGVGNRNVSGDGALMASSDHQQSSPTPPLQRRLAKSFSVAPSQSHTKG